VAVRLDSSPADEAFGDVDRRLRAKVEAEAKADRWMAARRVLAKHDLLGELPEDELRAKCADEEWVALCSAVALKPAEIILLLPLYDPWDQAEGFRFDEAKAVLAVEFFHELLTLTEGEWAGRPFQLELWQQAILMNLFGWVRADGSGLRRFREAMIEVPRKNGKSPFLAGIALLCLVADNEPGAQVYSAAGDRSQAAIIYEHARKMVENDEQLRRAVKARDSMKLLEYARLGSLYRALSKESKTKHGLNVHAAIVDELHVQVGGELVDTLTSATGTRRQPLIIYITTRDFDREGSICNEKERHADRVRRGLVKDPAFLPALWLLEDYVDTRDAKAWHDPLAHVLVNPNLGISIKGDEFAREFLLAQQNPRLRNSFIRLRLNGRTQSNVAWLPMDLWDSCGTPRMEHPRLGFNGRDGREHFIKVLGLDGARCFGGLDLSSNRDLCSFVLYFPEAVACLLYAWSPRFGAEQRESVEGISYLALADEGWLNLVDGNIQDYDEIRAMVNDLGGRFRIESIGYDRFGGQKLVTELASDGFEIVKVGQGYYSMSSPSKALERMVLGGMLHHGGDPLLRWAAGNVMVSEDPAGNIKPDKAKSSDRIDPITALVMAIGEADEDEGDGDAYAERGFLTL